MPAALLLSGGVLAEWAVHGGCPEVMGNVKAAVIGNDRMRLPGLLGGDEASTTRHSLTSTYGLTLLRLLSDLTIPLL